MSDRLLSFEAIENFRDFGGYATAEGRVRRGLLFRSGQHARATDDDMAALARLDLANVVDLRRPSERLNEPSRRPDGWQGRVFESDIGGEGLAPHMRFLMEEDLTAQSGRRYMAKAYARMPYEASHVALFKSYFAALTEGGGATLIHCTAGKDRTGLLAALTHKVLGVSDEDGLADYLDTNRAIRLEERADKMGEWLSRKTGRTVSPQAVVAFFGVEPDFLESAWSAIAETSGDLPTYLEQVLDVTPERIRAIRGHLCE